MSFCHRTLKCLIHSFLRGYKVKKKSVHPKKSLYTTQINKLNTFLLHKKCYICIMENENKGMVYFFRHKGLSPVKIGCSSKESYKDAFNQFNYHSPYGADVLGVIISDNPKYLSKKIHDELSDKKTRAGFFDISVEKINEIIVRFSDEKQISIMKKMSESIVRMLAPNDKNKELPASSYETEIFNKEVIMSLRDSVSFFDTDKETVKLFFEENNIENKTYRRKNTYVRGFKFFIQSQ